MADLSTPLPRFALRVPVAAPSGPLAPVGSNPGTSLPLALWTRLRSLDELADVDYLGRAIRALARQP
jgi:hypothetical protein